MDAIIAIVNMNEKANDERIFALHSIGFLFDFVSVLFLFFLRNAKLTEMLLLMLVNK